MSCNASPVRVGAWSAWFPCRGRHILVDARRSVAADTPDVSFLPVAQRKRLSLLSKIGLCLAHHTVAQSTRARSALANVFATRYGEYQRTHSILEDIAKKTAPAPAAFSSSVHNTTSGLWSIAGQSLAPSTTVTAGDATLQAGLLEAAGINSEIGEPVLFVYADVPLPERYDAEDRTGAAVGFAAIIEPATTLENTATLRLSYTLEDDPSPPVTAAVQVATLVELLTGTVTKFRACDGRITWNLACA